VFLQVIFLLHVFLFCFCLLLILVFVFAEKFFSNSSSQRETTVDVGKMKEVAQEPATPAEVLELFLMV
jgi:ABC-type protease/lipase transport system fused ATPase/permease subunit